VCQNIVECCGRDGRDVGADVGIGVSDCVCERVVCCGRGWRGVGADVGIGVSDVVAEQASCVVAEVGAVLVPM